MKRLTLCFLILCSIYKSWAFDESGEVTFENRGFEGDQNSDTYDYNLSLLTRLKMEGEKDGIRYVIGARGRVDHQDKERCDIVPEDFYIEYNHDLFRLQAGTRIFNWSSTEVFHPVDVVNSKNYDSELKNFEKLGEPVLSFDSNFWGTDFGIYYFPLFIKPRFPSSNSRLGRGVDFNKAVWKGGISDAKSSRSAFQWGVVVNKSIEGGDFMLHYLDHVDRENSLIEYNMLENTFLPVYYRSRQVGASWEQVFLEDYVLKIETAFRSYPTSQNLLTLNGMRSPTDHQQTALGFDYGISHSDGSDTTIILEGQFITGVGKQRRIELNAFQRDAMIAVRHALNDLLNRQVYFSIIGDLERSQEFLFNLNYTQRLNEKWLVEMDLYVIESGHPDQVPQGLEILNSDDHVYLKFKRSF